MLAFKVDDKYDVYRASKQTVSQNSLKTYACVSLYHFFVTYAIVTYYDCFVKRGVSYRIQTLSIICEKKNRIFFAIVSFTRSVALLRTKI